MNKQVFVVVKNKKDKKGYVSIEFLFGMFMIILTMLLITGMFCYFYPRQKLEKEVTILAQHVKVDGGLTNAALADFDGRLEDMGLTAKVAVYTKSASALNVAPRGTNYAACMNVATYNHFITRASAETIYIEVIVNSNVSFLKGPLKYFGAKTLPDNYRLVETVLSERNKC